MTLKVRCEPAVGKGVGNELMVGERAESGERGRSMSRRGASYRKVFIVDLKRRLEESEAQRKVFCCSELGKGSRISFDFEQKGIGPRSNVMNGKQSRSWPFEVDDYIEDGLS